jgi:GntR family transcriptional repressor for pyruvate dehydrogenase complex
MSATLDTTPLPPGERRSDAVHDRLRRAILRGELAPGDAVPSERVLAESLGVNRQAVREALNRLQQARLVHVAHGGTTRVLDWRRTAGIDVALELALTYEADEVPVDLLREIGELRAAIGADVARRFAVRATPEEREHAATLASVVAARAEQPDGDERQIELWEALLDGADNLAARLAFNTLMSGAVRLPAMAAYYAPAPADVPMLEALAVALRHGDPEQARAAAANLLERPLDLR